MNGTATDLRIGIVGLGYIGSTVGEQFYRHPDATVSAVCDLDTDRLSSAGDAFSVPESERFSAYESMLDDAGLDAVLIATPHTLHAEQTHAALDAGVHVYCDKPLTTDLADARSLTERIETGSQIVVVGYQRHLQAAFERARKHWHGDPEPRWITASISQNWIDAAADSWRLDPSLSGGGFLYDTGSHLLDGVCWTTGLTPTSVRASMDFQDEAERIDRVAHLDVVFEGGVRGAISVCGDAPVVREQVRVWGGESLVSIEGRGWGPRQLRTVDPDGTEHVPYLDPRRDPTRAEAFVDAVTGQREPPATVRDALVVTALTEAAYESARSERRVSVDVPSGPS